MTPPPAPPPPPPPGPPPSPPPGSTHPVGAVPLASGETRFLVWAPAATRVRVQLATPEQRTADLVPVGGGYHRGDVARCGPGDRYRFVLDDGPALADPASRSQPEGVHGPSEIVDLGAYRWGDAGYRPRPLWQHVIYEIHVGAFTEGGTFDSAIAELDDLVALGVTAVEPMPVAQFPGRRNWGYDGAFPFAVQDSYGGPHALQRFVDACHRRGLAVVLDVVYNHLGPEGSVLSDYGPYQTDRYRTPWGAAINFDGPCSDEVRAYFLQNARQWFADFHVDALRLDAVHGIVDRTATPFLVDLARTSAGLEEQLLRPCALIAESADNDPRTLVPAHCGGLGMDAQWNDDFHHALHAALTGERAGYYADFGRVEDLARAMDEGFVYQGEYSLHRRRRHGAPSGGIEPERFVLFAQNHDHVGNRPRGERLAALVDGDRLRLAAALLMLAPGVPLLFMGEEYAETAPFPYFVDHEDPGLLAAVRRGRAAEMAVELGGEPPDPSAEATFRSAVLRRHLRREGGHRRHWALHRALIALRAEHPALARSTRTQASAQATGPLLQLLRRHPLGTVVALFNVGGERSGTLLPEPPGGGGSWRRLLDSTAEEVGGTGGGPLPAECPGSAALRLAPWAFCAYGAGSTGVAPDAPATGVVARRPGTDG